jgi:hypothetical protein
MRGQTAVIVAWLRTWGQTAVIVARLGLRRNIPVIVARLDLRRGVAVVVARLGMADQAPVVVRRKARLLCLARSRDWDLLAEGRVPAQAGKSRSCRNTAGGDRRHQDDYKAFHSCAPNWCVTDTTFIAHCQFS